MIKRNRKSKETAIDLAIDIHGSQRININTGIPFFDHMLHQLAHHGRWDLELTVVGDIDIDDHHTVEDVALVLGDALQESWRGLENIKRYGQRLLPMDETLVHCAIDLCGRPYCHVDLPFSREFTGGVSTEMWPHFFHSLAMRGQFVLHLNHQYSSNNHHLIEASFKALAYALLEATTPFQGPTTTKGIL